jgi:Ca2+:H+ antiporter
MKKERKKDRKRREKRERKARRNGENTITEGVFDNASTEKQPEVLDGPRRVDFAVGNAESQNESGQSDSAAKRSFTLRGITGTIRPQMPKTLSQNVFSQASQPPAPAQISGPIPRVRYGIRRTNSLPDRLNQNFLARAPSTGLQPIRAGSAAVAANKESSGEDEENISRTTAVILLLVSTGLVAICAEFMVDSINAVVSSNSGLSEAFIGLIILPIVGNAAEHVTAVTVASKNKMDLAIGVAVGSSIQIGMPLPPFPLFPRINPYVN